MGPTLTTGVLISGGKRGHRGETTGTHRKKPAICKPRREASEAADVLTLCSQTPRLQGCEEIGSCCLRHRPLGHRQGCPRRLDAAALLAS